MTQKRPLSVIIPTKEADIEPLKKALLSVLWADEILIVDSSFSPKIQNLAEKFGAKVICHKYIYSAKQKNWAIPQAKFDWILLLDSDEVVTKKLRSTLENILASENMERYDGFGIARKHFFFGKFLRWGGRYPLYQVRLFKKYCRYEDRNVHAHIILPRKKVKFIQPETGDILHFSDRDFTQFFERFDRYSTYQANYMKKIAQRGIKINWVNFFTKNLYFKSVIKDLWFFIPFSPLLRFVYMYLIKLGFLDGRSGLSIALLYGAQDYISKTKYYSLQGKKISLRVKIQGSLMEKLADFSHFHLQKKRFIKSYQKVFISWL